MRVRLSECLSQRFPAPSRWMGARRCASRPRAATATWCMNCPLPRRRSCLRWARRLQEPNTAADLRLKAGDDAAVKVCLSFDLPLDRVPFMERQVLRIARARARSG